MSDNPAERAPAPFIIRPAGVADIPATAAIYGHHVLHGLASFEEAPPDVAEMERRWQAIVRTGLPYYVADRGGVILGYAYAGPYRARPGYRYSVENSVYVDKSAARQGVGSALLDPVITDCTGLGYRQMVAVIGDSDNTASIKLHESKGFVAAGVLKNVGFKLGRWVDSVFLQRPLGSGADNLPDH